MPRNDKNHPILYAENVKNHSICCAKNVENHAIFVEEFWPDFYARGRFMKYSMSGFIQKIILNFTLWKLEKGHKERYILD